MKNEKLPMEQLTNKIYDKKGFALGKYILISLAVLTIVVGMNKFVFVRDMNLFSFADNNSTQVVLEYYLEKYGDGTGSEGVSAAKVRLGCHEEIRVSRDGQVVMKGIYTNGKVYEIE